MLPHIPPSLSLILSPPTPSHSPSINDDAHHGPTRPPLPPLPHLHLTRSQSTRRDRNTHARYPPDRNFIQSLHPMQYQQGQASGSGSSGGSGPSQQGQGQSHGQGEKSGPRPLRAPAPGPLNIGYSNHQAQGLSQLSQYQFQSQNQNQNQNQNNSSNNQYGQNVGYPPPNYPPRRPSGGNGTDISPFQNTTTSLPSGSASSSPINQFSFQNQHQQQQPPYINIDRAEPMGARPLPMAPIPSEPRMGHYSNYQTYPQPPQQQQHQGYDQWHPGQNHQQGQNDQISQSRRSTISNPSDHNMSRPSTSEAVKVKDMVKIEPPTLDEDDDEEKLDHRKRKRNRTIRSCVPCHNHKRKVCFFIGLNRSGELILVRS